MNQFNNGKLFNSYVKGGTAWPQIRGGINIYMLNTLFNFYSIDSFNWDLFIRDKLSLNEINSLEYVMNKLHKKAGINFNKPINLQEEWDSARAAVIKSLLYFIQKVPPMYVKSIKELLVTENANILQDYIKDNNNSIEILLRLSSKAKVILDQHQLLSSAFSYFISNNKIIDKESIFNIGNKYNINFSTETDITNAKICLNILESELNNNLINEFSQIMIQSICWGFDLQY